jgi:hypothetical protein
MEEKAEKEEEEEEEKEATVQLPVVKKKESEETMSKDMPAENLRLVISLSQTSDAEGDKANLNKVVEILRSYPGHDEIKLKVANGNKITHLRLFDIHADYCPELHGRLVEVVGQGGLILEKK